MPVEPAKSEAVVQEAPMEVDTPDTTAKEEKTEPVEEEMEVEEIKIISEPATTEPEKTEPEPVTETEEEVGFFYDVGCFFLRFEFQVVIIEKETVKAAPDVPKKTQEKEAIEEERESELEESSDDDYKPRPVNIMTYPARTKRSMLRRSAPLQSTTDESMPNSPVSVYVCGRHIRFLLINQC